MDGNLLPLTGGPHETAVVNAEPVLALEIKSPSARAWCWMLEAFFRGTGASSTASRERVALGW